MKDNKKIKILLAAPRGFCAGVDRAIEIVKKSIKKYGAPVYVRHEIVHNKHVVDGLKKIGAIFVEELNEIKDKTRPVIFSAHGVPKKVPVEAKSFKMEYVDATCPLVSKVHREAENLNKNGLQILLIGHKNHPEVIGTMGQLPTGSIKLIETKSDVENLKVGNFKKPLAYITQTTLSVDDTAEIINALKKNIRNSKISDLIEYSRSVHAEMNAIIKGAQNTADRMKGGKLFCTTYPCHNCARHIVFAGISEVYYIEPYTKSYATHLHKDSITDDEDVKDKVKILF